MTDDTHRLSAVGAEIELRALAAEIEQCLGELRPGEPFDQFLLIPTIARGIVLIAELLADDLEARP